MLTYENGIIVKMYPQCTRLNKVRCGVCVFNCGNSYFKFVVGGKEAFIIPVYVQLAFMYIINLSRLHLFKSYLRMEHV